MVANLFLCTLEVSIRFKNKWPPLNDPMVSHNIGIHSLYNPYDNIDIELGQDSSPLIYSPRSGIEGKFNP